MLSELTPYPQFVVIGFAFADSDPFTGIDLDACAAKDGPLAAWA